MLIVSFCWMLLPQILYLFLWVVVRIFQYHLPWKPFAWASLFLIAGWWGIYAYGHYIGRFCFQVKPVTFSHALVPKAFNGYRIVQISDLHLQGWAGEKEKLQKAVERINSLQPDLIVFTGDLVSFDFHELDPFVDVLQKLKATDGVVSVMGNHDYSPYHRGLSSGERAKKVDSLLVAQRDKLGWNLLLNSNVSIRRGTDSIAILGVENQSCGVHQIVRRGNLKQAMEGTDGMFRILLSHDPSHWREEVLEKTDIPLMLSGHTHAMQIRIFGFTPSRWAYPECAGRYDEGGQTLYVNIGLGGTLVPIRIGANPEITEITLKRE